MCLYATLDWSKLSYWQRCINMCGSKYTLAERNTAAISTCPFAFAQLYWCWYGGQLLPGIWLICSSPPSLCLSHCVTPGLLIDWWNDALGQGWALLWQEHRKTIGAEHRSSTQDNSWKRNICRNRHSHQHITSHIVHTTTEKIQPIKVNITNHWILGSTAAVISKFPRLNVSCLIHHVVIIKRVWTTMFKYWSILFLNPSNIFHWTFYWYTSSAPILEDRNSGRGIASSH